MSNIFYTPSGNPPTGSQGLSATMRSEFTSLSAAFDLVARFATTGAFTTTFNQLGNYTFTLPSVTGATLATTTNVATETTRATAAEGVNAAAIAAETARATAAEGVNAAAIATKAALAGATFSGAVIVPTVAAKAASSGYASLFPGDATHTGFVSFYNAANVRQGYIGFCPDSGLINVACEGASTGHVFNGTVNISGAVALGSSLNMNGGLGVLGIAGFNQSVSISTILAATPLLNFSLNNGAQSGSVTTNGTTTAYNTASDYRLKITFGLWLQGDLFDRVAVHAAQFKSQQAPPHAMFLAHELQDAGFGYAVTGEKDAVDDAGAIRPQMVDHAQLVPALWAMVQDLRGRLARLEARA